MSFRNLNIKDFLIDNLEKNFILEPTKVQEEAIPFVFKKRNTIVQAQTGTGKTLSFLLPLISRIDEDKNFIEVLVLTPTRELADQITKVGKMLTKGSKISVESVFGGHRIQRQVEKISKNANIVVGTPGRILEHLRNGTINLKYLNTVVIDEADQMLAYGFIDDIYLINSKIPSKKQILLFSATMQNNVQKLISDIMPNSKKIEIDPEQVVVDKIKQLAVVTTEERKISTLTFILETLNPFMCIIYARSKERAKMLYNELVQRGIKSVDILYGELTQSKRERILKDFRNLKTQILVSTDISARGIDVSGITHIFNFDVPRDVEYYVHRIGRTGRMGENGFAVTLMEDKEQKYFTKVEKYTKQKIKKVNDTSDYERSKIDIEKLKNLEVAEKKTKKYINKKKLKSNKSENIKSKDKNMFKKSTKARENSSLKIKMKSKKTNKNNN